MDTHLHCAPTIYMKVAHHQPTIDMITVFAQISILTCTTYLPKHVTFEKQNNVLLNILCCFTGEHLTPGNLCGNDNANVKFSLTNFALYYYAKQVCSAP